MSYILLMGLDEPLQHSLEQLFRGEGYEVISVSEGSEGQVLVMNREPGVIVMVDDMTPFNDEEVVVIIRRFTEAPIIVIGSGGETAVVKALLDGADVFLRRPINHRELLSRVRLLMRRTAGE